MNTKITKCCSVTPSRTIFLGNNQKPVKTKSQSTSGSSSIPSSQIAQQHATLKKQTKAFPALQFLLNAPVLRITACKGMVLQNRTAHMCHAIFLNKNYVWHSSKVRHFNNKHVLFHNAYHEHSFSLQGLVARHAFLLHWTFSWLIFAKPKPTCNDVIDALWPCRTAKGAQVRRHQTRIILSQLPAAIMVFS